MTVAVQYHPPPLKADDSKTDLLALTEGAVPVNGDGHRSACDQGAKYLAPNTQGLLGYVMYKLRDPDTGRENKKKRRSPRRPFHACYS